MNVATTIIQQIGGNKAIAMMGAKNLGYTEKSLQFQIGKNSGGITHIIIELNGLDLYNVEFVKMRNLNRNTVKLSENVFASDLKKLIETTTGMYLSL